MLEHRWIVAQRPKARFPCPIKAPEKKIRFCFGLLKFYHEN
jgi:hypothetical protein